MQGGSKVKDEDLDRCPRCKEDMWAGNTLCRNCQHEDNMDEWPGCDGNPLPDSSDDDGLPPEYQIECDICGHKTTDPEGQHHCHEDNSND